jgi:hypothetical protein
MNRADKSLLPAGNWRRDLLWGLSLLLMGVGARLWLIRGFGTQLPFWDQWDEARLVYVPYFEGRLSLVDLFAPSNEHRMFFNWFYDLALVLLNRQWDNQVEMVANVFLYCGGITGFAWVMAHRLGRKFWPVIALPLAVALVLPFAWENTLAGFHSQVYSTILVSLFALWLLGVHEPGSYQWICGVLVALAALCLPTSGIIVSAAICALVALKIFRQPQSWKRLWPTVAVCVLVLGIGLTLRVEVPFHRPLMAHSVGELLAAWGKYLAWPWIVVPAYAPFNMFPLFVLTWHYLRNPQARMPAEELVLALGLWMGLQGAATAYARGGMPYLQWRYMDGTCFVMVVNCLSIALLVSRYLGSSRWRALWYGAFGLWGIACAAGLVLLTSRAWQIDIPERALYQRWQLQNTRLLMATDDVTVLDNKPPHYLPLYEGNPLVPRPAHLGEMLAQALNQPHVRELLPACVRQPLEVRPNPEATRGFVTNGFHLAKPELRTEVSWGSCTGQGAGSTGRFESLPIPRSRLPYLEIPVAGDLGATNLALELVDLESGKRVPVKPPRTAGEKWLNCYVRAPAGEFKLLGQDDSETAWFAFKAPRETGRLSYYTEQILRAGNYVFYGGLALFLCNLALWLAQARGGAEPNTRP